MRFLVQLDCAELAALLPLAGLPPSGRLLFFYSHGESWGYRADHAGAWRVLPLAETELQPANAPDDLDAGARYAPRAVTAEPYTDLPELDPVDPLLKGLWEALDEASDRYFEVREFLSTGGDGAEHKLLGHPNIVQGSMQMECELLSRGIEPERAPKEIWAGAEAEKAMREWRLLLQLGSDEGAGMMWGDAGCLYFWIREEDLRQRRFERVWAMQQFG
jgi:uncharacterized protein YwqG